MAKIRLIDANALFDDLKSSAMDAKEWMDETQDEEIKIRAEQTSSTFIECALRVKEAPEIIPTAIEAEPVRHGRWNADCWCSECSRFPVDCSLPISNRELTKYFERCPHCGAKMDGGTEK